jgi:hypothetical protein
LAREKQMLVEQFALYRDAMEERLRKKHWIIDLAFRTAKPLLRILSVGQIDPDVTDFVIVLRKPVNGSLTIVEPAAIARPA